MEAAALPAGDVPVPPVPPHLTLIEQGAVPGGLVRQLRAAYRTGDVDLFEDIALEVALILVGG